MKVKQLIDEDFINYKEPSMFIASPSCTFKCEAESNVRCCQNSALALCDTIEVSSDKIIKRYLSNQLTSAIVFGGLEPLDSIDDLCEFLKLLRVKYACDDTVVIYTGYNKQEALEKIDRIKGFGNIICKFGRFLPNEEKKYDDVLGVNLASQNQYAERIG